MACPKYPHNFRTSLLAACPKKLYKYRTMSPEQFSDGKRKWRTHTGKLPNAFA